MRIVAPYVKYVQNKDNYEHIAKAARICYAAEQRNKSDYAFVEELWTKRNHRSPYRHGTLYYEISASFTRLLNIMIHSPYCTCVYISQEYSYFISTNCQFAKELDSKFLVTLDNFSISREYLDAMIIKYPQLKDIVRVSFELQTQISTSRELNRVSPNAICEQSTRFCNFSKDKFDNHVRFCQPHWFDALTDINDKKHEYIDVYANENGVVKQKYNDEEEKYYDNPSFAAIGHSGSPDEEDQPAFVPLIDDWISAALDSEHRYFHMLKGGMLPQDARGVLMLDAATKCFYTYSIAEWKHILDLRYKGTTGKPHPNAKIIAEEIYNILKQLDLLYNYE